MWTINQGDTVTQGGLAPRFLVLNVKDEIATCFPIDRDLRPGQQAPQIPVRFLKKA
jgi:hypothetical protein